MFRVTIEKIISDVRLQGGAMSKRLETLSQHEYEELHFYEEPGWVSLVAYTPAMKKDFVDTNETIGERAARLFDKNSMASGQMTDLELLAKIVDGVIVDSVVVDVLAKMKQDREAKTAPTTPSLFARIELLEGKLEEIREECRPKENSSYQRIGTIVAIINRSQPVTDPPGSPYPAIRMPPDRLNWLCSIGCYVQENSELRHDKWTVLDVDGEVMSRGRTPHEAVDLLWQANQIPGMEVQTPAELRAKADRDFTITPVPAGTIPDDGTATQWPGVQPAPRMSPELRARVKANLAAGKTALGHERRRPKDPTANEMAKFLLGRDVSITEEERNEYYNALIAIYWYANLNHGGQHTNLYSALSTSDYKPSRTGTMQSEGEEVADMYRRLCEAYD